MAELLTAISENLHVFIYRTFTPVSLCVSVSASSFLILSRSFLALEGFFLADVKIASTDKNTRLFRGLSSGGSLSCFLRPI